MGLVELAEVFGIQVCEVVQRVGRVRLYRQKFLVSVPRFRKVLHFFVRERQDHESARIAGILGEKVFEQGSCLRESVGGQVCGDQQVICA